MDKELNLIKTISSFYDSILSGEKGLKSKIITTLYGLDNTYVHCPYTDLSNSLPLVSEDDPNLKHWYIKKNKFLSWEIYVLLIQKGFMEGFLTGKIKEIASGKNIEFKNDLEIDKKNHYIHIILPNEFCSLLDQCSLDYNCFNLLKSLQTTYPIYYLLRTFLNTYRYATYQSKPHADTEIARSDFKKEMDIIVKHLPEGCDIKDLESFYKTLDEGLKPIMEERIPCFYEIKEGKILFFEGKNKKDARFINAWLYPEDAKVYNKEDNNKKEKEPLDDPYEHFRKTATIEDRLQYLLKSIRELLGTNYNEEQINLMTNFRVGKINKILEASLSITSSDNLDCSIDVYKSYLALLERANTYLLKCQRYMDVSLRYGLTDDKIKSYLQGIQKQYHYIKSIVDKREVRL